MAGKFKVGDVCIVIGAESCKEVIGMEVTITERLLPRYFKALDKVLEAYGTDIVLATGLYCPLEKHLKLKEFPGEQSVMQLFKVKEQETCLG